MSKVKSWGTAGAAFVAGGVSVFVAMSALAGAQSPASGGGSRFWREGAPAIPAAVNVQAMPSLSGLIKTVSPSVVYIFTTRAARNPHEGLPFEMSPFGFRGPQDDEDSGQAQRSLGSGFIVSADGYIVTNNHVVADTTEIRVQLTDGREFQAKLIGRDPQIDLGLIKIDTKDLPVVSLGDSDRLDQGDWVVALGNPLGLDHSASVGIVSGLARNIGIGRYDALLQTDAAINPGNSGGPLFNMKGEVVGINTAIVGGANNIGFAIPVNMAKEILPDLKEFGKAVRGQLGVLLRPLSDEHKTALGLSSTEGALIERVVQDSPADRAGLKPGDVVVKLNGVAVKEVKQLQRAVANTRPGSEVNLTFIREGKSRDAKAKLIEFKEDALRMASTQGDDSGPQPDEKLGITVAEISPDAMSRYKLKNPNGVIITRVRRGSLAEDAGLENGDVIREANRKKMGRPEDFKKEVDAARGKPLLLLVERDGQNVFLVLGAKNTR